MIFIQKDKYLYAVFTIHTLYKYIQYTLRSSFYACDMATKQHCTYCFENRILYTKVRLGDRLISLRDSIRRQILIIN